MSTEEDTYNIIFKAMQHPIRRRILRTLSESPNTYTEIQKALNIDNGLLNYHLDNMKDLITKNEEEKYTLSEFGKATTGLIRGVEEPNKITSPSSTSPVMKWLSVILALALIVSGVGLVTLNNSYFDLLTRYMDASSQLNTQRSQIDELDTKLRASLESSELVDVMKSYGVGLERAHISLIANFDTFYSRMSVNGTFVPVFIHHSESAHIYSPRDNMTIRVTANLRETTRNITIWIVSEGNASGNDPDVSTPLVSLEVKPDAFNAVLYCSSQPWLVLHSKL